MTVADLQKILRAVDPAVVLVSPRILERVIRAECKLPNLYWNIPHAKSYICDRQCLFRHAEQADLEVEPDQVLPDTVVLLARPDALEMSNAEWPAVLLKYWRRVFHAQVHLALEAAALSDQAVRERIEEIGRIEFEEVKAVLLDEHYLAAEPDDCRTYIEFAAVYLELRYFAGNRLPNFFPSIRDFGKVEALLARDVNAAELFSRTRLQGAPDPIMAPEKRSHESHLEWRTLVRAAQAAALTGNIVRAAILRMRASRVAPAAQTLPTRMEAEADVAALTQRLAQALSLNEAETADWTRHLTLLLDKADQGTHPTEAQVLEQLQDVCLDHEREIYTLDLVEYVLSAGKRPIKRPLPSQRLVRITKHLRDAHQTLQAVRLSDTDRGHLARLLLTAQHRSEEALRARVAPILRTAMEDVGLKPQSPIEQAAFDKMVAEMLDRITEYGFLTFSELRDTISRNQLKLPDVSEPEHFLRGDPLIRLDRRLGSLLDGVYRPGEFYVRWLERGTSLLFGTWWGRLATRYAIAPFLFAWVILFVLGLIVKEVAHYVVPRGADPEGGLERGTSLLDQAVEVLLGPAPGVTATALWWWVGMMVPLGLFLMALTQNASFRDRCGEALSAFWRGLRFVLIQVPQHIFPLALLERMVNTWVFQLFWWYVLEPGLIAFLLLWWFPWPRWGNGQYPAWPAVLFLLINFIVNSQIGRAVNDRAREILVEFGTMIRAGLLVSVFHFILYAFKRAVELVEYVLFSVDEWLRFRTGDGQLSLVVRTILGVLWYPVGFLTRFYMLVLIEPCINPLKLPISILAAKVVYPLLTIAGLFYFDGPRPDSPLVEPLSTYLSYPVAWVLVIGTLYLLPDAFGFLAWEIRENWRLYRSNRSAVLGPVAVGGHGETVRGLLQPGFHSGTVPALFARLRKAERLAAKTRDWQRARALKLEIEEVEEALHRFLERNLVALLRLSRTWKDQPLEAGSVHLSTNRIRFEIVHGSYPAAPVEIEIEQNNYWLLAGFRNTGWLEHITPDQRRAFATCLAALYKLADVDLVREQLYNFMPKPPAAWRLPYDGFQVWWEPQGPESFYRLRERPSTPEQAELQRQVVFARTPIWWDQWVTCWQHDQEGRGHAGLPGVTELVLSRSVSMRTPFTTMMVAPTPPSPPQPPSPTRGEGGAGESPPLPLVREGAGG